MRIFNRKEPSAAELLAYAISKHNYKAAATILFAGGLEAVAELNMTPHEARGTAQTAALALALAQANRN